MPVALVLGSLAGGMTYADLKREYDLTEEDIRALSDVSGSAEGQGGNRGPIGDCPSGKGALQAGTAGVVDGAIGSRLLE
jgi:hypothetical protein